jgi:hypothetical protein
MERTAVDWVIGFVLSNPNMTQEERTHMMRYARITFQRQIEEAWEHGRDETCEKNGNTTPCSDSMEYYLAHFK